jgi:hypothetical protein
MKGFAYVLFAVVAMTVVLVYIANASGHAAAMRTRWSACRSANRRRK